MIKSFGDRKFQFWHYTVSMGQLLIRSEKDSDNPKNIDIWFEAVIYSELPQHLYNLRIEEAKNKDLRYISKKINQPVNLKEINILVSDNKRYLVVGRMFISENELERFEYPYFVPHLSHN